MLFRSMDSTGALNLEDIPGSLLVVGGGYIGLGLTFGIPWALLALAFSRGASWAWALLGLVTAMRAAVALTVGWTVLRDRQVLRSLWLIPLRDLVALGVWLAGFIGHRITWRGETFELRNGKLVP